MVHRLHAGRSLRALRVFLLALCVCWSVSVGSVSAGGRATAELPPLQTPVPQLTPSSFEELVHSGRPALVEFFAPWCGHCKAMAPMFEAAAAQIAEQVATAEEGPLAQLAKVDCMEERELCARFNVNSFPTLKLIRYEEGASSESSPLRMYAFNMPRSTLSFTVFPSTVWRTVTPTDFPELEQNHLVQEQQQQQQQQQAPAPQVQPTATTLTLQQKWQQQENERRAAEGLPPVEPDPPAPTPPSPASPVDAAPERPAAAAVAPAAEAAIPAQPDAQAADFAGSGLLDRKQRLLRRLDPQQQPSSDSAATPAAGAAAAAAVASPLATKKLAVARARAEAAAAAAAAAAAELAEAEAEVAAAPSAAAAGGAAVARSSVAELRGAAADGVPLAADREADLSAAPAAAAAAPRSSKLWVIFLVFGSLFGAGGFFLKKHWKELRKRYNRHQSLQLGKGV